MSEFSLKLSSEIEVQLGGTAAPAAEYSARGAVRMSLETTT
jgi:hypothetical protein